MALAECSVLMAHMAGLIDACRTLAARVAVLEQRPAVSYMGVWEMGKSYQPGQFVTHGGSLWACHEPTSGKPGTSPGWQLAAKRGRDGKGTAQLERKCS